MELRARVSPKKLAAIEGLINAIRTSSEAVDDWTTAAWHEFERLPR